MIPDQFGTPIVSGKEIQSIFNFEFDMDPAWLLQHCELVAFVQDTITMEVVQAQSFSMESLVMYNDIAVHSIINPGNSYCLNDISPVIEIENFGLDTLFNCLVTYAVNGSEYTCAWEGQLTTYSLDEVELPEISFILENLNSLQVEVSLPNGQPDEYPDNNTKSKNFYKSQVITFQNLILELKTDNFGGETSWDLLNSLGEIVYTGNNYDDNTLYTINWELNTNDCYSFIIYDSAGNGICCESGAGYYKVKNENELVYFVGGNFEFQDTEMFEIDVTTGSQGQRVKNNFTVYPNPFNENIFIESDSEITKIEILNSVGEKIYTGNLTNGKNLNINLSHKPKGIYFLKIFTDEEWEIYKVLKD